MSDKRIIEYDAATAARTDDNILMDSPAVGTRKITKANFLADVYTAFQTIGNSITDINTFIGNETLQTEANTITGAINEILNNAATAIELTQAEYDALVLADEDKENVPYYISDAQSPAQIGLWAKVGSDELNVGDDLSDAVNELDNSVRTIKSNLTDLEDRQDLNSFGTPTTLTTTYYTAPCDGYMMCECLYGLSHYITVTIRGADEANSFNIGAVGNNLAGGRNACFIRKGMSMKISQNSGSSDNRAYFYPLV